MQLRATCIIPSIEGMTIRQSGGMAARYPLTMSYTLYPRRTWLQIIPIIMTRRILVRVFQAKSFLFGCRSQLSACSFCHNIHAGYRRTKQRCYLPSTIFESTFATRGCEETQLVLILRNRKIVRLGVFAVDVCTAEDQHFQVNFFLLSVY